MDYFRSFSISAAGMAIERMRVDVSSLNLANANTIQDVNGQQYRPMTVVARAGGVTPPSFGSLVDDGFSNTFLAGPTATVEPMGTTPRTVYEPANPFADGKGFVTYAGTDPAAEMISMMSAMRSYEANVAAMNTARTMAMKALEIGGTS